MDLHLLWTNDGRMFIKPLPRYLLSPEFWIENLCCPPSCECKNYHPTEENSTNTCGSEYDTNPPFQECQRRKLQKCAMGFLYTYACLISYESDFTIAVDKHLCPSGLMLQFLAGKTGRNSSAKFSHTSTNVISTLAFTAPSFD